MFIRRTLQTAAMLINTKEITIALKDCTHKDSLVSEKNNVDQNIVEFRSLFHGDRFGFYDRVQRAIGFNLMICPN